MAALKTNKAIRQIAAEVRTSDEDNEDEELVEELENLAAHLISINEMVESEFKEPSNFAMTMDNRDPQASAFAAQMRKAAKTYWNLKASEGCGV